VNLFEASTVRWQQDGHEMTLSVATRFPLENSVHATVKAATETPTKIRVRVPSWASRDMEVSINGKTAGSGKAGSYLTLDRKWKDGDAIAFTLPASIRVTRYRGEDQIAGKDRYSVEYGPILLAAVGDSNVDLALAKGAVAEALGNHLEPVAGAPLHFTLRGDTSRKLMPYYQVTNEKFTCYPTISAAV